MARPLVRGTLIACSLCAIAVGPAEAQRDTKLGTIDFPTSATSSEAQAHFIRGTAMLHSFEWEDAAEAFQEAQRIEPEFAMAYWGEALSHTTGHHFPSGQNLPAAREILSRLGPTREARAVKAPTAREKAYLAAIETLYGRGDAETRALGYADAMRQTYEDHPDDLEAAAVLLVVADADRAPRRRQHPAGHAGGRHRPGRPPEERRPSGRCALRDPRV